MKFNSIEKIDIALKEGFKSEHNISCDELLPYYILKMHSDDLIDKHKLRDSIASYIHSMYKTDISKLNKIEKIRFGHGACLSYLMIYYIMNSYEAANDVGWLGEYRKFMDAVNMSVVRHTQKKMTTIYHDAMRHNLASDFKLTLYDSLRIKEFKLDHTPNMI